MNFLENHVYLFVKTQKTRALRMCGEAQFVPLFFSNEIDYKVLWYNTERCFAVGPLKNSSYT